MLSGAALWLPMDASSTWIRCFCSAAALAGACLAPDLYLPACTCQLLSCSCPPLTVQEHGQVLTCVPNAATCTLPPVTHNTRAHSACGAGLEFLWRLALEGPPNRHMAARMMLVNLHVKLAKNLQPHRTDARRAFLEWVPVSLKQQPSVCMLQQRSRKRHFGGGCLCDCLLARHQLWDRSAYRRRL